MLHYFLILIHKRRKRRKIPVMHISIFVLKMQNILTTHFAANELFRLLAHQGSYKYNWKNSLTQIVITFSNETKHGLLTKFNIISNTTFIKVKSMFSY